MYQKPILARYGTLRELTRSGAAAGYDVQGILADASNTCSDGTSDCWNRVTHS